MDQLSHRPVCDTHWFSLHCTPPDRGILCSFILFLVCNFCRVQMITHLAKRETNTFTNRGSIESADQLSRHINKCYETINTRSYEVLKAYKLMLGTCELTGTRDYL